MTAAQPCAEPWEQLHAEGFRHQLRGEWEQARQYYEQALACKPGYPFAELALAQLRMLQSCFREGRDRYEWRFTVRQVAGETMDWRSLPTPRWRGEKLHGKHLHLWVEGGFGDVIMYAAFLPAVIMQQPSHITLSMFPKMMTLFQRSFPQITVESLHDIGTHALSSVMHDTFSGLDALIRQSGLHPGLEPLRQDYERIRRHGKPDFAAPMGDLMVYGLPDVVPAQQRSAYLKADPQRVSAARTQLHSLGAGRLIGMAWHSDNKESGLTRSIPLERWLPLLRTPGCHFISLQYGVQPAEIERFCAESGCRIITGGQSAAADTERLAALTACMDEVITIDNSSAHLAGALAVPTTLLLPKGCDFRWPVRNGATDTLWYHSVKVERQAEPGNWQPVIARVAAKLRDNPFPK